MPQFDVYRNRNPRSRRSIPYLLDVQSDLLTALSTRVVVPLIKVSEAGKPLTRLNPRFRIKGTTVIMSTAELAGVPTKLLGDPVVSLRTQRDEIISALDFLITGI